MQRKIPAIINKIISYSDEVKLFRLKPKKRIPDFTPGQFLHFAIDEYDPSSSWPESRIFSIASSPSEKDSIDLIVSKKGRFTSRMMAELKEGDEIWIKLPFGSFNFSGSENSDKVLIAGGTGITPFMPFLKELVENGSGQRKIKLFYGVRSAELVIINKLIIELEKKLPKFNYQLYIEESPDTPSDLHYEQGMLPVNEIINDCIKLQGPVFYLSGPGKMIKTFMEKLSGSGIAKKNINFDEWE